MDRINVDEYGNWVCRCGNIAESSGFAFCLPDGTLVEPLIGGPWQGHYRCGECDRVILDTGEGQPGEVIGVAKVEWKEPVA